MLKHKAHLEVSKEDRLYSFSCATDAPLGEIFDALCQMKGYVMDIMQKTEKKEAEEPKENADG